MLIPVCVCVCVAHEDDAPTPNKTLQHTKSLAGGWARAKPDHFPKADSASCSTPFCAVSDCCHGQEKGLAAAAIFHKCTVLPIFTTRKETAASGDRRKETR